MRYLGIFSRAKLFKVFPRSQNVHSTGAGQPIVFFGKNGKIDSEEAILIKK